MKVTYGTPVPCPNCGSDDIHCTHSFGAQVFCGSCGVSASKVPGNNWQDEEYAAVDVWNKTAAEPLPCGNRKNLPLKSSG